MFQYSSILPLILILELPLFPKQVLNLFMWYLAIHVVNKPLKTIGFTKIPTYMYKCQRISKQPVKATISHTSNQIPQTCQIAIIYSETLSFKGNSTLKICPARNQNKVFLQTKKNKASFNSITSLDGIQKEMQYTRFIR